MAFNSLIVLLLLAPFTLGGFTRSYDNCAVISSGNININLYWSFYTGGIQVGIESSNANGITIVGISQKGLKGFGDGSGTFSDFWAVQSNKNDRTCSQGCVGDCYSETSGISFDKIQDTMETIVSSNGGINNPLIYGEFTRNLNTNDTYDYNEGFQGTLWVSWGINREVVAFGQQFDVTTKGAALVTFSRDKPSTCGSNTTPGSTTGNTASDSGKGTTGFANTGKETTGKTTDDGQTSKTAGETGRTTGDDSTGKTSTGGLSGNTGKETTGKTTDDGQTSKTSGETGRTTSGDSTGKTSTGGETGRTNTTGDASGKTSTGDASSGKTSTGGDTGRTNTTGDASGKSTSSDNTGRVITSGSKDTIQVYLVNMEVTTTIEITKDIFAQAVAIASSASSDRLVVVSFDEVKKAKRADHDYDTSFYFKDSSSGPSSKDLAYKFTSLNGTSLGSNITVTNVNVEQTAISSETANNAIIYAISSVVVALAMLFC